MQISRSLSFVVVVSAWMLALVPAFSAPALAPLEELGKALFFDPALSTPPGLSCAACHEPSTGFTGPSSLINATQAVYPGAVHERAGNRKPPSAAYGGESPVLYFDSADDVWVGGMFWDGRATGWTLGDPLAEQAMGPFLNPLEQNTPHAKQVIRRVAKASYAPLFEAVWGEGSIDDSTSGIAATYKRIVRSIAAYERSNEVSPFSSKYDAYLNDLATLTAQEAQGLQLFEGKAMCSGCHLSEAGPGGEAPLFTDFTYDNLGVPKNPLNPFYDAPPSVNRSGDDWVDPGLGGFLAGAGYPEDEWMPELGKQKVPTLRNVGKAPYAGFVKAFGHNGYFKSLAEIVHFYNTRDVESWPAPEIPVNVNTDELGNLGLTAEEEAAIVAFLNTLTDGYSPFTTTTSRPVIAQPGSRGLLTPPGVR